MIENTALLEKIRRLPPEKIRQIEDFVDLIDQNNGKNSTLDSASSRISELEKRGITREAAAEQRAALSTFADDWELPEMNIYDEV